MTSKDQVLSTVEDLSRPTVTVNIPVITITMEDLAFLRSLTQEKGLRCSPGHKVLNKLRFLDLIARAKVAPPVLTQLRIKREIKDLKDKIKISIKEEKWQGVIDISYSIKRCLSDLESREDDVLTEKGKEVLRSGQVNVRVRKVGCPT